MFSGLQGVDLSVEKVTQQAVFRAAQEADRMFAVFGDFRRIFQGHFAYIEIPETFTQEIDVFVVIGEYRVAVFHLFVRQVGKFPAFQVVNPDIPAYGRFVVFPPVVFISFIIVINDFIAFFVEIDVEGVERQKLFRPSSIDTDLVHLPSTGELAVFCIGHDIGTIEDFFTVGSETYGDFAA